MNTYRNWNALLDEFFASEQSGPVFCRERDLPYSTFCRHRKSLLDRQEEERQKFAFLPVAVMQEAFQPECVSFKINGIQLDLPADIPKHILDSVVKGCIER